MKSHYAGLLLAGFLLLLGCQTENEAEHSLLQEQPVIYPDYAGVTIPPNIAPLNFIVQDDADAFRVVISSEKGDAIVIRQASSSIQIPRDKWRTLLQSNKGNALHISVETRKAGKWMRYMPIIDTIASEPVDGYLVYRLINTGYILWRDMQIAQRNLENFEESFIFRNSSVGQACVNCHSFCRNDHNKMSMHIRRTYAGTLITNGPTVRKVDTKTSSSKSAGVYTSWHPDGRLIAFSCNKIRQYFTSFPERPIIVSDDYSDIELFDTKTDAVIPCPALQTKNRETLPCWSPDGKWLYFVCAPPHIVNDDNSRTQYSLCRIAFNADNLTWGKADTLIAARDINRSMTFPRVSPDGKYILFCMTDFGYFTVFDQQSELYFYEIATGRYWPLACNSPSVESTHSWSENSRWFVFASKRMDNMYTRPFFAYVDSNGSVHKPFVMPQADPSKYMTYLLNYNLPELVDGKVEISERKFRDVVLKDPVSAIFQRSDSIDACSGETMIKSTQ